LINRLTLPLETKARKKWAAPLAGKGHVYGYIVLFFLLCKVQLAHAQAPVANFNAVIVSGCAPLQITFHDLSTGNPTSWNWDLGNGSLSNLQNPATLYTTPGTYTVTLVVRNANGTNGITKTNYITVYPSPLANFDVDLGSIACLPAKYQFSDRSTTPVGTITKWQWDFGDGTTSTLQNPTHLYSTVGFYTIGLSVTSSTGCVGSTAKYRYLRVVSGVTPDFKFTVDSVCRAPFNVQFINQTSGPGALTYNWTLGNGNNTVNENPSTVYNAAGTYNITLVAKSEYGCSDTITKAIDIVGATTTFSAPDSGCLNQPVNFLNTSTPTPVSSVWDFGDGTGSTKTNPSKSFGVPTSFNVKLINKYPFCTDSTTKTIQILFAPSVGFTSDVQAACKGPLTVKFQDLSPDAVKWLWNFGDGSTSTQKNPTHTYAANGTYNVMLTITSSFGCINSVTIPKFIKILKPELSISNLPNGGCIPYAFNPIANVISVETVSSYSWDFGDGSTDVGVSPSHTYVDSGTYTVKLTVTTNGGCTETLVVPEAIRTGPAPTVDFTVDPANSCASSNIKFKAIASAADHWTWDFGDGNVSEFLEDSAFHAYADTGYFDVKLTVVNNGCANTTMKPQVVHINPPVANFIDTVLNCSQKTTVTFTNTSKVDPSYGPVSYLWQFGDLANSTSNAVNPSFTYPSIGTYTVTLTVTNGACVNTISQEVKLVAETADFTATKVNVCRNELFAFDATANPDNISQFEWLIGANPPLIGKSPNVTYSFLANGVYSVTLTVTDLNGCTDTKTRTNYITVTGPTADFSAIDPGGCTNSIVRFSDVSATTAPISEWKWNFGDGQSQTFTASPFTHKYADTGYFQVRLEIKDNQGCIDSITKVDMVRVTSPKAEFYAPKTLFCPGGPMPFKDSSSGYITGYNWIFGDGGSSSLKDPTHVYSGNDSTYNVTLVVTDTVGCKDSITKMNYVQIRSPKPAFDAIDTTSICPPLETKFILKGVDYESYYWDFGDGETSLLKNPTHFYNIYGNFTAKLYVAGYGGCVDSLTRNITITDPYTSAINYSPLEACDTLVVTFDVVPPPHTKHYLFFGDQTADSSQALNFTHSYYYPQAYSPYLFLTDEQDCQIQVGGPKTITVFGAQPLFSVDKFAFCDTGTVFFTNYMIANDPIVSHTWNFGDGNSSNSLDASHTYTQPGTYYPSLTANTAKGCSKTFYDTVKVYRTPQPLITSPDIACIYSTINFDGSLLVADSAITYNWTFGNGLTSKQQNASTSYNSLGKPTITLVAANFLGCKDTTTKNIQVMPLPQISILSEPTVLSGTGIVIPATYTPNVVSYLWTPNTALSCTDCPNPFTKPQFTTKYKVSVIDSNGCTASRDITVTVVCNEKNYFIPNTFSPNGDGINDVFYPRGSGINRIFSMRIFNRWGELVFERKDFNANEAAAGWNGTVKGKPAEQDVYVYIIEFICDNATIIPYRGNVALIR